MSTSVETKSKKEKKPIKKDSDKIKDNIVIFIVSILFCFIGAVLWYNYTLTKNTKGKAKVCFKGMMFGIILIFIIGLIIGGVRIGY